MSVLAEAFVNHFDGATQEKKPRVLIERPRPELGAEYSRSLAPKAPLGKFFYFLLFCSYGLSLAGLLLFLFYRANS